MSYKDPEKQKEYQRKYFQKNKEKSYAAAKKYKTKSAQFVREYKQRDEVKCKCGESRWQCLDFHHRKASSKIMGISVMVSTRRSIEDIKKEIKKCDVVCANCHRILHTPEF